MVLANHSPATLRAHARLLRAWLDTFHATDCGDGCDCDSCPFSVSVMPRAEMPNDDLVPMQMPPEGRYTICMALQDIEQSLE